MSEISSPTPPDPSEKTLQPATRAARPDAALPPRAKRRRRGLMLAVAGVVIVGLGGTAAWQFSRPAQAHNAVSDAAERLHQARAMDLDVTVKKEGELQAVKNTEILCDVPGTRTITFLIGEGTRVKQGDTLAVLSSEDLEEEIERLEQDIIIAEANLMNAREALETQQRQNAEDIEGAQVLQALADLDLRRYELGEYPQEFENARTRVEMAEIRLANAQEDLQNTLALFSKGFVTAQRVKTEKLTVKQADNDLDKARTDLTVLTDYQHPMDLQSKQDKLRQASNRVERVKASARTAEFNREQSVARSQERLEQLQERLAEKQEELDNCTIKAPEPGLVVYHDDGRNDIAEGVQVRYRQTLMLLPDTDNMKAVVRVPENRVGLIRRGMRAVVDKPVEGFSPLTAKVGKISVLASSDGRWYNRDTREYPIDLMLDQTPRGLKPGVKIEATVFVERLRDVLAVPLQCVYTRADQAFVFVSGATPATVEARQITLGKANETHAQIVAGLAPGERILELQVGEGRELLEKLGVEINEPATNPALETLAEAEAADAASSATAAGDAAPAVTP